MKRYIACAIMCAMLLSTASCGDAQGQTDVTTPSGAETTENTADTAVKPDIPSDLTLGGETITILYRDGMKDEFWTEEQTGDVVNDAVFNRNAAVESALDCKLEYIPNVSTNWDGGYQAVISQSVLAGDEEYDIISGPSFHIPTLIVDGYLSNLNGMNYLDFDKPWWAQSLLETTAFGDKIFLVSGDISMGMIRYLHCTYYNMELGNDYGVGDIYKIVLDGKWTLDKLEELTKDRYEDLNSDGNVDVENDRFGYLINNTTLWRAYIDSLGVKYLSINKYGIPEFNFGDERSFNVADAFAKLLGTGSSPDMYMTGTWGNEVIGKAFKNDQALFCMGRFVDCETDYRDMKSDYAIIPVPKWDEDMDYAVTINGSESTFGVPVNSSKTDYIGAVMEMLAYESYERVTPAYYESALKIKYTRGDDADSAAKVIDLIRNGAVFNPIVQLSKLLGGSDYMIQNSFTEGKGLASVFAEKGPALEEKLSEVLEKIS